MLRAGVLVAWLLGGVGCEAREERPPAVALAQVESAKPSARTPGVILTVTRDDVEVDGTRALKRARAQVQPMPRERSRFELGSVERSEGGELQTQLGLLFEVAGLTMSEQMETEVPELRVRADGAVRFGALVPVLAAAGRVGYGSLEYEVATAQGVGHFKVRPYTLCACPMPPGTTWCAAPVLRIGAGGVTLIAEPDLRPPTGCHKVLPGVGEAQPPFAAEVDWRSRAIAGPDGGCPSAQVGAGGLDVAALARRLAAVNAAAPGCGWASVAVDPEAPWSVVAPALVALFTEFGELRVWLRELAEGESLSAGTCANALDVTVLRPAPAEAVSLQLGRRGCGE